MGPALVVYLQLRHLAMSYALEYTFAFRSTTMSAPFSTERQ